MRHQYVGHGVFLALAIALPSAMAITSPGLAGTQSASIVGHVVDASGQPVPGVSVTTVAHNGGVANRAISGRDGAYQFGMLPDGTYRVDFDLLGFDMTRRNHVQVRSGTTATADATLAISMMCECVNVGPPLPELERSGQVLDESNRPIAHAQLQVIGPGGSERAYADSEGRFKVRLPVNDSWSLIASDSGFREQNQRVSSADASSIIFRLAQASPTGLPDVQRLARPCCPSLFTHERH